jgi:glycosyltransferase involved in cell wall biosynthesis
MESCFRSRYLSAATVNLCLFIPSLRGGGAERMFVRMATRFAHLGHHVDIVLMSAKGAEYCDELSPEVRLVDLQTPRLWTSLPAFRRYVKRERPHAVISAMPLANGIAAWAKQSLKRPPILILTEHNAVSLAFGDFDVPRYRPLMWAIRSSYRFADALVGVSRGVADRLRRMPAVKVDRTHVIYNPAWHASMEARALEPVSHPWLVERTDPVVLAVGRLEAQKDFATLLRAFALLRQRRPVRLIIMGEGSQRPQLEQLAQALGIDHDVSMAGFTENPFAFMARANVFVLSSIHEGFGNVVVEAMACGTPVVSTDCPSGPSEILDGGRYGPLVPGGEPVALSAAIEQQLDHPTPAAALRARAREFSVEASADAYLKLIHAFQLGRS